MNDMQKITVDEMGWTLVEESEEKGRSETPTTRPSSWGTVRASSLGVQMSELGLYAAITFLPLGKVVEIACLTTV